MMKRESCKKWPIKGLQENLFQILFHFCSCFVDAYRWSYENEGWNNRNEWNAASVAADINIAFLLGYSCICYFHSSLKAIVFFWYFLRTTGLSQSFQHHFFPQAIIIQKDGSGAATRIATKNKRQSSVLLFTGRNLFCVSFTTAPISNYKQSF